ncbi:acyl carrier protein [Actinosynnema sp. ALI-1.44]|nr:acyl carrier protein [Actinosynnema sp. ALI-1.44]
MKIRRDLLGVGEARAEPDFFDLSGESLLFIRMVAGIRGHFGARSRRG